MFLSQIAITHRQRSNPYHWHRDLWKLFDAPDEKRSFLFQLEQTSPSRSQLIMLSALEPTPTETDIRVLQKKGFDYRLCSNQKLGFRLCANPVKTIKDERKRLNNKNQIKSCRVPLIKEEQQIEWLEKRINPVAKLHETIIQGKNNIHFRKNGRAGKIAQVTYEGLLEVTNADGFIQLIQNGIGPAKAFGCGLMLVRRI